MTGACSKETEMSFVVVLQVLWKLLYCYIEAFLSLFISPKRKDVTGDIVLVTGAGHGIGREIALEFGRLGAKVVIWDINKVNLVSYFVDLFFLTPINK